MASVETDLSESIQSLRFYVAAPGGFAAAFPEATDDDLLAILMDGFAEAQLYGLFPTYELDEDGIVTPGLTRAQVALVVLLGAIRLLGTTYAANYTSVTYKAGSAEYSTSQNSALQRDIFGALLAQRKSIIDALLAGGLGGASAAFLMADQYLIRVCADNHYGHYGDTVAVGW